MKLNDFIILIRLHKFNKKRSSRIHNDLDRYGRFGNDTKVFMANTNIIIVI